MKNKHVRIWNSELAYRIDSQLPTQCDRSIFRKLLTQNKLDEEQLKSLLSRWRKQSDYKSFCEFLAATDLIVIELRKSVLWESPCDSESEELCVSLTPRARDELNRIKHFWIFIVRFIETVLATLFDNSLSSEKNPVTRFPIISKTKGTNPRAFVRLKTVATMHVPLTLSEPTCTPGEKTR